MTVALPIAQRSRLAPVSRRANRGPSSVYVAVVAKRALLALVAMGMFAVAADAVLAAPHGSPASPVGSGPNRVIIGESTAPVRYVVQDGDSSWSVASQLADPSHAGSTAAVLQDAVGDAGWVEGTELLIAPELLFVG